MLQIQNFGMFNYFTSEVKSWNAIGIFLARKQTSEGEEHSYMWNQFIT